MRFFTRLIAAGLLVFIFNKCIKDLEIDPPVNNKIDNPSMAQLNVPASFNWETTYDFNLTVSLAATKAYQPKSKISVYDGAPELDGRLIASGSVTVDAPFGTRLKIPAGTEFIYIKKEGPFGSMSGVELEVTGQDLDFMFSDGTFNNQGINRQFLKSILNGPDCDSGCNVTISGNSNVNISGGQTYCVTESFNGKITFQSWNGGGTLRICGTANLTNNTIGMYSNCHIVVTEGATLTMNTLEMGNNSTFTVYNDAQVTLNKLNSWSENCSIVNYGNLTINQDSYSKAPFHNYGTADFSKNLDFDQNQVLNSGVLTINKSLEMYGANCSLTNNGAISINNNFDISNDALVENWGTLETGDNFKISNASVLNNYGEIIVNTDAEFNGTVAFTNACQFICNDDLTLNSAASVSLVTGYLKAADKFNIYTTGNITLSDGSMIRCAYTEINKNVVGTGNLNSFVVYGDVKIWNNNKIDGAIEMAIESGELVNGSSSNFINGATYTSIANALNYLPVTACNPDGLGTPTIVDTDNDGIPDELDDYPADPERAFNNYFPEAGGQATLAFEDLWPATGDYDFNDLVVAFYGNEITNASNQSVDMYFYFVVEAVGASMQNGLAFQLDNITPGMIEQVSGMVLERGYIMLQDNGTEANQDKAVIIVTENVEDVITRNGSSMFNTKPENPPGTADTTTIYIHFSQPVDRNLLALEYMNPFLIKNQQRSIEIHLPYYAPTSLMNTTLFGTGQDASNPETGMYFVTSDNLPWGLLLFEPFDYPVEKAEITTAYNFFATWAESGGTLYHDWYHGNTGYRNYTNIYSP